MEFRQRLEHRVAGSLERYKQSLAIRVRRAGCVLGDFCGTLTARGVLIPVLRYIIGNAESTPGATHADSNFSR
jgi:hypothetical protein